MVYLFLGQDYLAKDAQLKKLRQATLAKETEEFNFDIIYAKDATLKSLQEKLLCLPVRSPKRLLVLKAAECLKKECQEFLLGYLKKPFGQVELVLDVDNALEAKEFVRTLSSQAKVVRFRDIIQPDTFSLSRQIALRKADVALRILHQLLEDGQRPEMILGGLRYAWERESASPLELKRRLKFLLACDIEIKTGKLRPNFALEKLVVRLCGPVPVRRAPFVS